MIGERARGALMGLAAGDAFGTTQEFTEPQRRPFPALNLGPQTELVGGGPFELAPGQVTDDTQMAVCLAEALRTKRSFDPEEVKARYVAWRAHAFDIGVQTRAALSQPGLDGGLVVWEQQGRRPAGNGSLMRTTPLAVFFAADPALLRRAAIGDSLLTHADPRCLLACAALNAALAHALTDPEASAGSMSARAEAELPLAARAVEEPRLQAAELTRAVHELGADLAAARADDPQLELHRAPGFVRTAFRLAFWELAHAGGTRAAILDAGNRGGDADTNAAITGALCGALFGASSVPPEWWSTILAFGAQGGDVWADDYHPRRLLALVG